MPATLTVRRAEAVDIPIASAALAAGFTDDPVGRWIFPEETGSYLSAFFDIMVPVGVEAGQVLLAGDGEGSGAAVWLPFDPADDSNDPALGEQLAAASGPYADRLAALDELMASNHPHHAVHAYLPFIAVHPSAQGRGLGGALLEARTRELDREGLPAYLEATTLRSAALYERFGFVRIGRTLDLPGGPPLYPMWREPR